LNYLRRHNTSCWRTQIFWREWNTQTWLPATARYVDIFLHVSGGTRSAKLFQGSDHVGPGCKNPSLETLTLLDIINTSPNDDDQAEDDQVDGEEDVTINTYEGNVSEIDDDDNLLEDETESDLDIQDQNMTQSDQEIPTELLNLQKELLGGYKLPTTPPETHARPRALEDNERLSLQHYIAWRNLNGMVLAYNEHWKVLEASSKIKILSLFCVCKLAASLTGFHPTKVDMCPKSCYTGSYKNLESCLHISTIGVVCGSPCFKSGYGTNRKLIAQVTILPIMETVKALFANAETSHKICHRDACLRAALDIVGNATKW
jgi:hypothetical protein